MNMLFPLSFRERKWAKGTLEVFGVLSFGY